MGDKFGNVAKGTPLMDVATSRWFSAVNAEVFGPGGGTDRPRQRFTHAQCKLKNTTGTATLDPGSVVTIGDMLIDPNTAGLGAQQFQIPTMKAIANVAAKRYAILQEPFSKTDGMAHAVMAGICYATVDISNASHNVCGVDAADFMLQSGNGGWRIVSKPSGTGEKVCLVDFNFDTIEAATAAAAITAGSSGNITLKSGGTVTGYYDWFEDDNIANNDELYVHWRNDVLKWQIIGKECA